MAEAEFLIVRLIPTRPISPSDFRKALSNVTITARDERVSDADHDGVLGSATGLAGEPQDQPPYYGSLQHPIVPGVGYTPDPLHIKNAIIQHYNMLPYTHSMYSVATVAVIIDTSQLRNSDKGRPSCDVTLELAQDQSDVTIASRQTTVDYNVLVKKQELSDNQDFYMKMDTDIYMSIDVPASPISDGTPVFSLSMDGTPPSFDSLRKSINAILQRDPPEGADSLESMTKFLSIKQAELIASELTTNRLLDPPPAAPYPTSTGVSGGPPKVFENMFTISAGGDPVPQDIDQARMKFEEDRASYYNMRSTDASQLANYVYSVIAAVYAEHYTANALSAVLQVPIQADMQHEAATTMPTLALMGDADDGLNPAFTIPAAFFYALMTRYSISQDFETRLKTILTSSRDALAVSLSLAIDSGVLGSRSGPDHHVQCCTTLRTSKNVTINELQAIRRIAALQASVLPPLLGQVKPSKNDTVKKLITSWLEFPGPEDDIASKVWFANPKDYLTIIFEVIAPGEELLISTLLQHLKKAPSEGDQPGDVVSDAQDLLSVTETQWLEFFVSYPDLLPDKYLLGDLAHRVHAFVQDITKVIFVSPPPTNHSLAAIQPSTPHFSDALVRDVLVHFLNSYNQFSFTDEMSESKVEDMKKSANEIFKKDPAVASFVVGAATELWFLYRVTGVNDQNGAKISNGLRFSYMEALHARGFVTADKIQLLAQDAFARALSGTVAFPQADNIHAESMKLPLGCASHSPEPEPGRSFHPVNGGGLTNCEPASYLSPFGPVQYLNHLLRFSLAKNTVGELLESRRGPIANLLATESNLNAVVPVVDIVNENLEFIVAGSPQSGGAIYNTHGNGHEELEIHGEPEFVMSQQLSRDDILRALPQHSTPRMPLDQPTAYDKLTGSVAGPHLPYSRGIDFSSSYLEALGSSRYETLHTFSRDITEFSQDASKEPQEFQKHLFRLPVRYEIALSFIGISPVEAELVFSGKMTAILALELLGYKTGQELGFSPFMVSQFIRNSDITYNDFLTLHRSKFLAFGPQKPNTEFPDFLPASDESLFIVFSEKGSPVAHLLRLTIFVRLWRRLSHMNGISMDILADICKVLGLFSDANVNPEFLRQLSSLLMIQNKWELPWTGAESDSMQRLVETDIKPDERTPLLSIWSGRDSASSEVKWAVKAIIDGIERCSMTKYKCPKRSGEWERLLSENLDMMASLAGFDGTHRWNSSPTSTIRFMEVLSKVYASNFTVGEILFLFTTESHLRSDDPFPYTEDDESLEDPLNVPEDLQKHGLWNLRRKLLDVEASDKEIDTWTWPRIEATLHEIGYAPQESYSLAYLAEHFFPEILVENGHCVPEEKRRFTAPLKDVSTPSIWGPLNAGSPFFYYRALESESSTVWAKLPLQDERVLKTLRKVRQLSAAEAAAVQEVYLKPRTALAPFALLFSNFDKAAQTMTEEPKVERRFRYFQREVCLFYKRCRVIAHHIHEAVVSASHADSAECCTDACHDDHDDDKQHDCRGMKVAWKILLSLIADENRPETSWEMDDDSGQSPQKFHWQPHFSGNAFAALLGLVGTGVEGMYYNCRNANEWKEIRGGLDGWGVANNYWNAPLPTLLPGLTLTPSKSQNDFLSFKNGFAFEQETGNILSGAEPFTVVWTGTLLVDQPGCYRFAFSCPLHSEGSCDQTCRKFKKWKVKIQRGQKSWNILDSGTFDDEDNGPLPDCTSKPISMRRGAYKVTSTFQQLEPNIDDEEDLVKMHSGFCLSYSGEDTGGSMQVVPLQALYIDKKDGPLWAGQELSEVVTNPINLRYVPTLRDVRRTYQRAFKSVLFAHRFHLSATISHCEQQSELGFLLGHPSHFCGTSYYWRNTPNSFEEGTASTSVRPHQVNFDFNFLPVIDAFYPPERAVDARAEPSPKRQAAMFDWWERIFDYTHLRSMVRSVHEPNVWLLFYHGLKDSPQPVNQLLRFLGIGIEHAPLALEYFAQDGLFRISNSENTEMLGDERWITRIWYAGRWLERLHSTFYSPLSELSLCRPALWATSPDPDVAVVDDTPGNLNLLRFVQRSCLGENDATPRLGELVGLNDGLRLRARQAMLEYLLSKGRTVRDLSDKLLMDVEAGMSQSTTRIAEAVSSVQSFVQRALMGLEPPVNVDCKAAEEWENTLATLEKWKLLQKRTWYYENWIQWDESKHFKQSEAYKSLGQCLATGVTSVPTSSQSMMWPGVSSISQQPGKMSLSTNQLFSYNYQKQALDEGVSLIGAPDRSGRPAWLAPVHKQAEVLRITGPEPVEEEISEKDMARGLPPSAETDGESLLPAAASLDFLPLWIQAVLQLGVRFIRVAASGLPVAAPYDASEVRSPLFCSECCKEHPPVMDEYYFWLQDARRFDPAQAPAPQNADLHNNTPGFSSQPRTGTQIDPRTILADPTSDWDTPTPEMLWWQSTPIVHLHWTRVHMGLLRDPRRSTEGIPLDSDAKLDELFLSLRGRQFDSLLFNIKSGDSSLGFRYDIATDTAVPIPEPVASLPPSALPLPQNIRDSLASFPYFLYFKEGAPLVPLASYGTSLVVSRSLREDCHYLASTQWLRSAYDPLARDNSWVQYRQWIMLQGCQQGISEKLADLGDSTDLFSDPASLDVAVNEVSIETDGEVAQQSLSQDGTYYERAPVSHGKARGRAATLEYIETLLLWADSLSSQNSLESEQKARTILSAADRILGPKPREVQATDLTQGTMTIAAFRASPPALNPRLVYLYEAVGDRLELIRRNLNTRRLSAGIVGKDRAMAGSTTRFNFSDEAEVYGPVGPTSHESSSLFTRSQNYRFTAILPRAAQWVATLKATGAALLAAFDRGDSEALSAIKAAQDRQLTELSREVSQNQYRAADWDVQGLDKQMENAVAKLQYYQKLLREGLNPNELGYILATTAGMASRTAANIAEDISKKLASAPDTWCGIAGFGGTPLQFRQMPTGCKLGTGFAAAARILNTLADISNSSAMLELTLGGWDRRAQEWQHQADLAVYEIQQIKRQRLAARRRLDVSLRELNNTERRIQNSAETQDFLANKFTKYELFLYLQQENAALYKQLYDITTDVCQEVQQAARYELGDSGLDVIPSSATVWDSLHEGLLAGEKLGLSLSSLERAYMNQNCREYELNKPVSLRLHFPAAFVLLKSTGYCEVDIPEFLFDLDYPGHFMRRLKSVSLSIPCVAEPNTGVHCRLQQLRSSIRVRPKIGACSECRGGNAKQGASLSPSCVHDPELVTRFAGTEAIATSSGQNDSGLFEISFSDARYLPFEYTGAISSWGIELPPENNQFDLDSLSDLVINLSYTARESGPEHRKQCHELAQSRLLQDRTRFLDIKHELPDIWSVIGHKEQCSACEDMNMVKACCDDCTNGKPENSDWKCTCYEAPGHLGDDPVSGNPDHRGISSSRQRQKKQRHHQKSFELQLSRQMFPFMPGGTRLTVSSLDMFLDMNDYSGDESSSVGVHIMHFTPEDNCKHPDVKEVTFIKDAGGIWRGRLQLAKPVLIAGDGFPAAMSAPYGKTTLGTFTVSCGIKNVRRAWMLCAYDAERV